MKDIDIGIITEFCDVLRDLSTYIKEIDVPADESMMINLCRKILSSLDFIVENSIYENRVSDPVETFWLVKIRCHLAKRYHHISKFLFMKMSDTLTEFYTKNFRYEIRDTTKTIDEFIEFYKKKIIAEV